MMMVLMLAVDVHAFAESHPSLLRLLLLTGLFASGWFEAFVLRIRTLACVTWFTTLAALAVIIGYSLTTARIVAAAVVFGGGLGALIVYYRRHAGEP